MIVSNRPVLLSALTVCSKPKLEQCDSTTHLNFHSLPPGSHRLSVNANQITTFCSMYTAYRTSSVRHLLSNFLRFRSLLRIPHLWTLLSSPCQYWSLCFCFIAVATTCISLSLYLDYNLHNVVSSHKDLSFIFGHLYCINDDGIHNERSRGNG